MPGISAVIITFNEARNIGRCLSSLEGIADEIVVVDGFSSDETADIARSFGAKVIQRNWNGFVDAKNFARESASQPYILSLDADEALSGPLRKSILAERDRLQGGYRLSRKNYYCGKWIRYGGWYPDLQLRLAPRDQSRWEGQFVHEALSLAEGLPVQRLAGDLDHFTIDSAEDHLARINRYSGLTAKRMLEQGKKAGLLRLCFGPVWKFLKMYVVKLGFLDGYEGFLLAVLSASGVFLRYVKLRELLRKPS
jgi:glycosyltransferase involved in cell wall biosynthesis